MNARSYLFRSVVVFLALILSSPALALTIKQALIAKGKVMVKGNDVPGTNIRWQGVIVTQADSNGRFTFKTVIPPDRDCTGFLQGNSEFVEVKLKNCRMTVRSFYSADQDTSIVPTGQFGSVRSKCDLGDFAVSGSWVVRADNFRIISNVLVIDGATGVQSWVMEGMNEGSSDADIRVSARCADVNLSGGSFKWEPKLKK